MSHLPDPFAAIHQPSLKGLWSGNIRLARKLVALAQAAGTSDDDQEMYFRGAVSKNYYALFHYARYYAWNAHEPASERLDPLEQKNAHRELIDWYKDRGFASIKLALETGRTLRNVVDYESKYYVNRVDHVDAETCCKNILSVARSAFKQLEFMISPPAPTP